MIGGTEKGSFIPVTFALVREAREVIGKRYSELAADIPFNRDTIVPFKGERDALLCPLEKLFKENANRSLAAKNALWKEDLWVVDDVLNDNYFTALDARADLEAERYAARTGCAAYKDKRQEASNDGSSVVADLTYAAAMQSRSRDDFYAKSGAGWSHPT
jgi:hypothetical protein